MTATRDGTPAEALELAGRYPIALPVTDLMMPGGTGVELASRVRACQTGVPVILVSSDPDAGGAAIAAPSAFLRKPFSLRDLTAVASSLLEVCVPSVPADSPRDIAARVRGPAAAPSTDPVRPVGWT